MQTSDKLLLRALRREPLPRPPVWLMRQAGRFLPEYRAVREEAGGFLEMVKNPELAAEVTLQPIRRFRMDAAIVFSDILVPLEAMGLELEFGERGPVLPRSVGSRRDVSALRGFDPSDELGYVGETLRLLRDELPAETALIGFAGAPFTLAAYAVEGGASKTFSALRTMMYRDESTFAALMDRLADAVAQHLAFQAESGAEVLALFDTWAGELTREDYRRYAAPWTSNVLEVTEGLAPRILFVKAGGHLLADLVGHGVECVGLDHRIDIGQAFDEHGSRVALQGNLDPAALLAAPDEVARRTRALLEAVAGRPGHVLNLGHGVIKDTEPDCVASFVEVARGGAS